MSKDLNPKAKIENIPFKIRRAKQQKEAIQSRSYREGDEDRLEALEIEIDELTYRWMRRVSEMN